VNVDKAIRYSTIAAVGIVALVAGFVSYRHALQVVTVHGESGLLARAYPLTIDGLIYAASMVLLNAARRGLGQPVLAYVALGLGIAATLAANVAAGLAYGLLGAVVAAWPAPALVISYELLMVVIRTSVVPVQTGAPAGIQVPAIWHPVYPAGIPASEVPGEVTQDIPAIPAAVGNGHLVPEYGKQAAEVFAAELAAGRVPGIKPLRQQLHIGQDRAQKVRDYLTVLAAAGVPS
jgi:hypothetical protein